MGPNQEAKRMSNMRKFFSSMAERWFLFDSRKFAAEWMIGLLQLGVGALLLIFLYRFSSIAPGFGRGVLCWLIMTLFSFKFFSAVSGCEICPVTPLVTIWFTFLLETGATRAQRHMTTPPTPNPSAAANYPAWQSS